MSTSQRKPSAGAPARAKPSAPPEVARTKKQIAFGRKEARQKRIIWLGVAGLCLIVLAIAAAGLISEFVAKPGRAVALVNGQKIRLDDYQSLLQYRRYSLHTNILDLQSAIDGLDAEAEGSDFIKSFYEQQLQQLQLSLETVPDTTLDELIEDTLILEKAAESTLIITDEKVKATLNEQLREAASPAAQATITQTEGVATPTPVPQQRLDEIYENVLTNMGLKDQEFLAIMKRGLLREEVQNLLASQLITTGLVAQVQLIQRADEAGAQAALERIQNGEEFAVVAREVSSDTVTADSGGDLGWVTTGQVSTRYGEELETAVFAMTPGEIDVVSSNDQFYVIKVVDRSENGPLPDDVMQSRKSTALSDWLAERKASPEVTIERKLDPSQIPPDPFSSS